MRFIAALLVAVSLAACDAPATQPGPASPLLGQVISEVVEQANSDRDPNIATFISIGGRMQINFIDPARRPLAAVLIDRC